MPDLIVKAQPVRAFSLFVVNVNTDKQTRQRVGSTYYEACSALEGAALVFAALGFKVERQGAISIATRGKNVLRFGLLPETELPN